MRTTSTIRGDIGEVGGESKDKGEQLGGECGGGEGGVMACLYSFKCHSLRQQVQSDAAKKVSTRVTWDLYQTLGED
jgi:hypothetical protein